MKSGSSNLKSDRSSFDADLNQKLPSTFWRAKIITMTSGKQDSDKVKVKRKFIRFPSDPNTIAEIEFRDGIDTTSEHTGLVINEAKEGCGVVIVQPGDLPFKIGHQCVVKVGELSPIVAELRWIVPVGDNVYKLGFLFLE